MLENPKRNVMPQYSKLSQLFNCYFSAEFSESLSSHEDNDHEPMEIDDDSDETLSTELTENAEVSFWF